MASRIPVADAVLDPVRPSPRAAARHADAPRDRGEAKAGNQLYFTGLTLLCAITFLGLFMWATGKAFVLLVVLHDILWPLILVGTWMTATRLGGRPIFQIVAPLVPFVLIGAFSGFLGVNPVDSARQLSFFVLGLLGAASIGLNLRPERVLTILFWTFVVVLALSIVAALLPPHYGVSRDVRGISGNAWCGIFFHKNLLGAGCALATAVTLFAREVRPIFRLGLAGLIVVNLLFSASQGGIVTAVTVVGFSIAVSVLRRSSLSSGVRVLFLSVGTIGAVVVMLFASTAILQALGRDPTLSGRSAIWSAFLQRASYFWLTGAGPGTFVKGSAVTVDITRAFASTGLVDSPHNRYIAVFGEVGIVGFAIFLLTIGYFTFVLPLVSRARNAAPTGAIALVGVIGGIVETRDVYGQNSDMFLMMLVFAGVAYDRMFGSGADRRDEPPREETPAEPEPAQMRGPLLLG